MLNDEERVTSVFPTEITVYEHAAMKLAEAQHAPGVTCRMNPRTFSVEYINPDGTIVPGYEYFLKLELQPA